MKICRILTPLLCGASLATTAGERPNILCIVCEDISPYLGCYGDPMQVTPNLDRFASEAIRYTGMYTTIGVSAPSRAALITGMYPSAIGANNMRTQNKTSKPEGINPYNVVLPEGMKPYTEFMRMAGYYCTNNEKTDFQFESPLTAWDQNGKEAHWKNAPESVPFFAIFNLRVTHEAQIWSRGSLPLAVDPANVPLPPYFPDDPIVRHDVAVMYSNIAEMDRQFQAHIDELKAAGKWDNTIVIWYSDNGGPLPRQKRELYESGALVPFMVRFPDGYGAGTVDSDLHLFPDIPATILSLAGVQPPAYMQGRAFLGEYRGEKRDYIYGARDRLDTFYEKQAAVRDDRYRLIRNFIPGQADYMPIVYRSQMPMMRRMVEMYENGEFNAAQRKWFEAPRPEIELYDVANDPYELNNLAENPTYTEIKTRLSRELDRWITEENPMWHYTERELIEKFWPGGVQPITTEPEIMISNGLAEISCSTSNASIAYQINNKGYTADHWFLYTAPIQLQSGDEIKAIAVRPGYAQSEAVSKRM